MSVDARTGAQIPNNTQGHPECSMFRRKAVAASAAILFCVANSATAAPLSADQILNQFNLVVFGDHQLNSQVHGRAFIGGDVTGAGQITTKN